MMSTSKPTVYSHPLSESTREAKQSRHIHPAVTAAATIPQAALTLRPSILRPPVPSAERLFAWKGIHTPPPSSIHHPLIVQLASDATRAALKDSTAESYGAGLRKFHIFCDIFSIPEGTRLPASFDILHSFVLWATANPNDATHPETAAAARGVPLEPVSVQTASNYLAAVRAWHVAQGWPPPLSDHDRERIDTSLRGVANIQRRVRAPRPPVTIPMLAGLKASLNLDDPFEACLWAIASCAFWGLMRFGEATVRSRASYDPSRHLSRSHAIFSHDESGKEYLRLDLREAKTAKPGEVQHIFLVPQLALCPLEATRNLARVVPAGCDDPLFSWRDRKGDIRPMTRDAALRTLNGRLLGLGYGTTFGHSFRIGGASFLLAQGTSPEVVRMMGRWRSLAYELYVRAFERVVSHHTAHIAFSFPPPAP